MGLVSELRRRNVLRMAVLYAVAAWLILQVAEVLIDLAKLPDWIGTTTLALLAIGFPIALIVSWFYEITPEGISLDKDVDGAERIPRVSGRRLDLIVISLLCAAVILFAYDKWWTGGPAVQSIAVLPFTNMSADPEQEYFSDGISEELLNVLAQIKPLKVIARTSSFSFKGKDVDIATMAAQLNVRHILEGSVRRSGDRVRITAQLIDASDSTHVWSQTYDRELGDIFAVQDEIAAAISNALKVRLAIVGGAAAQPTIIKAANTAAYDAYLQGRELIRHRGRQNVEEAVRHLERSLRLDNNFAPAHAQLAIANTLLAYYGASAQEEAWPIAIAHLERAQELEPELAETYGGRALLALNNRDPESTIEHARKALESNPSYSDAMNWLYIELNGLGRYEEADAMLEEMLIVDPLTPVGRYNYAEWLAWQGRVKEAHQIADQLLAQSPMLGYLSHADTSMFYEGKLAEGLSWALRAQNHYYVMFVFSWVGEYAEARRIAERDSYWVDTYEGRFDEAIRVTQRQMQLAPNSEEAVAVAAGILYYARRIDEALPLFERALDFVPDGRPLSEPISLIKTIWLALARRKSGDEDGAHEAAQIVRQDLAARRAAGRNNPDLDLADAMIEAFENNPEDMIAALKSNTQRGNRNPQHFDDPIFDGLRDDARFVALREELDAILAVEHDKVLQLICFNNPVPDDWQPLPETCDGVEEQRRL